MFLNNIFQGERERVALWYFFIIIIIICSQSSTNNGSYINSKNPFLWFRLKIDEDDATLCTNEATNYINVKILLSLWLNMYVLVNCCALNASVMTPSTRQLFIFKYFRFCVTIFYTFPKLFLNLMARFTEFALIVDICVWRVIKLILKQVLMINDHKSVKLKLSWYLSFC